jgi:parallel beta-helix repeat protein
MLLDSRFPAGRLRPISKRIGAAVAIVTALTAAGAGGPQAAPPPPATIACGQTVSGSVRLAADLHCTDSSGLVVGADGTSIDLNGHKIVCTGTGFEGSCQGSATARIGVDTNNYDDVHVFSHVEGGTIEGFDRGVYIRGPSDGATVKQLTLTGPDLPAVPPYRPSVYGVLVEGDHCAGGNVLVGDNEIDNQTTGIRLNVASCVNVSRNSVHDNGGGDPALTLNVGIRVRNSSSNIISGNVVTHNGSGVFEPAPPDAGISLDNAATSGNQIVGNEVNDNNGQGISTAQGASGNMIVNNTMRSNGAFDAYSDGTGSNSWTDNNRCRTQTIPDPPAGVCNPAE